MTTKPTKICETCRHGQHWSTPGGREEPPDGGIDCMLEENEPDKFKLVVWTGDEGCDVDCPAWEPHEKCERHPETDVTPGYGCPECEAEGDAIMSANEAHDRIDTQLENLNTIRAALVADPARNADRLWAIERALGKAIEAVTSPSERRLLHEGWEPYDPADFKLDKDYKVEVDW